MNNRFKSILIEIDFKIDLNRFSTPLERRSDAARQRYAHIHTSFIKIHTSSRPETFQGMNHHPNVEYPVFTDPCTMASEWQRFVTSPPPIPARKKRSRNVSTFGGGRIWTTDSHT
jgi:hypothetical protein